MRPMTRLALLGVLLALPGLAVAQRADNANFAVVNRTQWVLNQIFVSSSASNNWGRDLLGRTSLAPGSRFELVLPPGQCLNDIRVVFSQGTRTERRQVNTCILKEVVFP